MMKVILEKRRGHDIWYLRFYYRILVFNWLLARKEESVGPLLFTRFWIIWFLLEN